ncbi:hypothetical protein ACIBJC_27790 [Streptomyces sp. NPDC050509]
MRPDRLDGVEALPPPSSISGVPRGERRTRQPLLGGLPLLGPVPDG